MGIARLVVAALLALMMSGCMTTLGYIPETVKPKADIPSYSEVKGWAARVGDGYDSRATMNRYSIYAGATLAAAAVSAIAGLAAFGSNSSALIGIPIGTGFLGALAGLYQSDEKAAIYGHGARYVKGLIVLSEARIQKFDEDVDGAVRVAESQAAEAAAQRDVGEQQGRHAEQRRLADEADSRAKAARANPATSDAERAALEKAAQSLQELASQAEKAVAASAAALKAAEARSKAALHYQGLRRTTAKDTVRSLFLQGEAVCLQQDVNGTMAKVADHIAVLDPKDLAARLKAVKAENSGGSGEDTGTDAGGGKDKDKPKPPRLPPPDLSDLTLPAKSSCIY